MEIPAAAMQKISESPFVYFILETFTRDRSVTRNGSRAAVDFPDRPFLLITGASKCVHGDPFNRINLNPRLGEGEGCVMRRKNEKKERKGKNPRRIK